jgi:hypothetical protein
MPVTTLPPFASIDDLLKELKVRPSIRLVKVADYSFTQPQKVGTAFVMQPKVKLVVSAYDPASEQILKWDETQDARSMISINAGTGTGTHSDSAIRRKSELIRQKLELEGFSVAPGEWTERSVQQILAS